MREFLRGMSFTLVSGQGVKVDSNYLLPGAGGSPIHPASSASFCDVILFCSTGYRRKREGEKEWEGIILNLFAGAAVMSTTDWVVKQQKCVPSHLTAPAGLVPSGASQHALQVSIFSVSACDLPSVGLCPNLLFS